MRKLPFIKCNHGIRDRISWEEVSLCRIFLWLALMITPAWQCPLTPRGGGAANMIGEECLVGNEDVGPLLPAQHVTLHKIIIGQTVR